MANAFPKNVEIAFDEMMEGFESALTASQNVTIYNTNPQDMERASDVKWIPQPYIAQSFEGSDATQNFTQATQLVVPVSINRRRHVPFVFSDTELRDLSQSGRLKDAAQDKLAADIDVDVITKIAAQGNLFVKRTAVASGFADMSQIDTIFNEQGIPSRQRFALLNSTDYNSMADNLQVASRSFGNSMTDGAYRDAYIGRVSSIETFKLDYPIRRAAAAGGAGLTISTLDAGGNVYTPTSLSVATTNEMSPVDNRTQLVTVSSTTNVAAGDSFTIATLNAVHHLTKTDTGKLKTFKVIAVNSATTMTISPPIITNQVANDASAMYQNCTIGTKAANSAIVFLNTVAAPVNVFFQKNAVMLLPGTIALPAEANYMKATTKQGLTVYLQKGWDTKTSQELWRIDTRWGTHVVQPEMVGEMLMSQT